MKCFFSVCALNLGHVIFTYFFLLQLVIFWKHFNIPWIGGVTLYHVVCFCFCFFYFTFCHSMPLAKFHYSLLRLPLVDKLVSQTIPAIEFCKCFLWYCVFLWVYFLLGTGCHYNPSSRFVWRRLEEFHSQKLQNHQH